MTLAEIIETFPDLFYRPEPTWYRGQAFMDIEPKPLSFPFWTDEVGPGSHVTAVDLAALYVKHPEASVWRKFLWTDDVDFYGNRVYVGGVGQYGIGAFQIHRKLEPAAYWVRAA